MVRNTESQESPEDSMIFQDFVVLFLFFNGKMLKPKVHSLEVLIFCSCDSTKGISWPSETWKCSKTSPHIASMQKINETLTCITPEAWNNSSHLTKLLLFFPLARLPQVSRSILHSHRCTQEAVTDKVRDRGEACGWKRITICKERRCQGLSFCLEIKRVVLQGTR